MTRRKFIWIKIGFTLFLTFGLFWLFNAIACFFTGLGPFDRNVIQIAAGLTFLALVHLARWIKNIKLEDTPFNDKIDN